MSYPLCYASSHENEILVQIVVEKCAAPSVSRFFSHPTSVLRPSFSSFTYVEVLLHSPREIARHISPGSVLIRESVVHHEHN